MRANTILGILAVMFSLPVLGTLFLGLIGVELKDVQLVSCLCLAVIAFILWIGFAVDRSY